MQAASEDDKKGVKRRADERHCRIGDGSADLRLRFFFLAVLHRVVDCDLASAATAGLIGEKSREAL